MISSKNKAFAQHVDDILTRFAAERLKYSSDTFRYRFISYLHMCHSGDSLQSFLRTASSLTRVNMSIYRFFRNPFCHQELAFLFVAMTVVIMGLFFLAGNQCELGFFLIAGSLVHTIVILRKLSKDFCENDIQFYIYNELKQIIDNELQQSP